jgi:hypothetical protein
MTHFFYITLTHTLYYYLYFTIPLFLYEYMCHNNMSLINIEDNDHIKATAYGTSI